MRGHSWAAEVVGLGSWLVLARAVLLRVLVRGRGRGWCRLVLAGARLGKEERKERREEEGRWGVAARATDGEERELGFGGMDGVVAG